MMTTAFVYLLCQLAAAEYVQRPATCPAGKPTDHTNSVNYLRNPAFAQSEDGKIAQWSITQHAGEAAYRVTVNDGELKITKHGEQYYMMVSQFIDLQDLKKQSLSFSVEMKQNMHADNWYQGVEPGAGLLVNITGSAEHYLGPKRGSYISQLEHEPKLGVFDWTEVSVCFDVSEHAQTFKIGFIHQAYGDVSFRNPQLTVATDGCANAATSRELSYGQSFIQNLYPHR